MIPSCYRATSLAVYGKSRAIKWKAIDIKAFLRY